MEQLIDQIKELIGSYIYQIMATILFTVPIWFIMNSIKQKISLWLKKRSLINDTILSLETYYEICGHQGVLKEIGKNG